jgi:hypothetical protein
MSRPWVPLLLLLLPAAWGGGADGETAGGATITVEVDGHSYTFANARAELQSFLGGSWLLDVSSGQGDGADVGFAFLTPSTTAAALAGEALVNDYREDNPDRHPLEDILNFVRIGNREYQGHLVEGTVVRVSDTEITLAIRGTFLVFPADWEERAEAGDDETPPVGREVTLAATITVPLSVEEQ